MTSVEIEFTVEPFAQGAPGPHVLAAVEAARALGWETEMGPFATTVRSDTSAAGVAAQAVIDAALEAGAERISLTIHRPIHRPIHRQA